jgi:hypothetical protein
MNALITGLQSIGGPVCLAAADRLQSTMTPTTNFDLHLRRAGLDGRGAVILADAIREVATSTGAALRSFSASYNPDLTDAGVIALSAAFPLTMSDLGLVGCGIGDRGDLGVLSWAQNAASPRMICIEENDLSLDVRAQFSKLGRARTALMVVV